MATKKHKGVAGSEASPFHPFLSADKRICTVTADLQLMVGQHVDYVPTGYEIVMPATIVQFKLSPLEQSVWMKVRQFSREEKEEFISVSVWHDNRIPDKITVKDDSPKPSNTARRPF